MSGIIPRNNAQFLATYGRIAVQTAPDGRARIVRQSPPFALVPVDLPLFDRRTVHVVVADDLVDICQELETLVSAGMIVKPTWDGCFVPRHKGWNPKRGLSLHTWGIAVDLNAADNPMRTAGKMNRLIVQCFERRGWTWGGRWSPKNCDPMHFQRAATAVSF